MSSHDSLPKGLLQQAHDYAICHPDVVNEDRARDLIASTVWVEAERALDWDTVNCWSGWAYQVIRNRYISEHYIGEDER